jgi:hypothetical protein
MELDKLVRRHFLLTIAIEMLVEVIAVVLLVARLELASQELDALPSSLAHHVFLVGVICCRLVARVVVEAGAGVGLVVAIKAFLFFTEVDELPGSHFRDLVGRMTGVRVDEALDKVGFLAST